ncbi:YopX family protein [Paenibacillus sp. FSL L8-0499]|uniref:YopX family protein n=1 Tax=Paenibacillus sp. FSL L8-0499 TaxID=2975334 RepID=UPI0030FA737E
MGRERKYRGRHINTGEWVYGYLIGNDVIVGEIVEFNDEYFITEYWYRVDPETVGQYIGLKDKNDREIYAGDIPRDPTGVGEIEWVQEHCAYMVFTKNPSKYLHLESDGKLLHTEIIGNIYDNPELIEV